MMKKGLFIFLFLMGVFAYGQAETEGKIIYNGITYEIYGEDFVPVQVKTTSEMLEDYKNLSAGDSIEVAFKGKVQSVCKKMGCWVRIGLDENDQSSLVKFKDHEFFVPTDSENADAIVKGYAFVNETTVAELQHFAEDAGKSQEEIDAITEPKTEYTFVATGVLLKQEEQTE